MKKKKFVGISALLPLALFNVTALPVYAEVTEYQEADTNTEETSAECQVIYKSTYDFSEEIPKYPELEVSASGYEGIYDGKSHGITVDCKTEGVTILYSTDGKNYSANKPEYTNAGTYVTYYKVEKDGYTTTTGSETIKIAEAKIDYTANDYNGLYDGQKHSIDVSIKTDGCKILYSEDGINFTSKKPEYKEPGTYTVYYKILKDNYETVTGNRKVIIKEKDTNIKLSDTGGTVKVDDTVKFTVDTDGKPFDITISDSSIAKVTVKNGVVTVTGLKEGTATITITCNGKSATYTVTVVGKDNGNSGGTNNSSGNINNKLDTISNVQTGDESNILFYGAMFLASVFGLAKNKDRKEKKKL